jgi:hypothetical protein
MELSTMCKDAIETCTGCLMKFPDEKTLLKHLSLKKKCQDIYNLGLLDPSIASDVTLSEPNRDVASTVAYYYSAGQKRKKINNNEIWGDDSNIPDTNSFATYAFPQVSDKLGNSQPYSSTHYAHSPKSKYSMYGGNAKEVDLDYCHPCKNIEKHQDNFSFPQEFESQSTDEGSQSSTGVYNESSFVLDDPSSDDNEEQEEGNIAASRDSLKVLANMMRRRHVQWKAT